MGDRRDGVTVSSVIWVAIPSKIKRYADSISNGIRYGKGVEPVHRYEIWLECR